MIRRLHAAALAACVGGLLISAVTEGKAAEAHPIVYSVRVEKFGYGDSDAGRFADWDATLRVGTDEHRLVLKTEGERERSKFTDLELSVLYDRPVGDFWNLQLGWRRDFKPRNRNYFAFGFAGLAPNFLEVETTAYVSEKGALLGRFKGSVDLLITRNLFGMGGYGLFVEPWIELNASTKADRPMDSGAGLTTIKPAVQVRYEFERWLAPYVEVGWERKLGQTARFAREEGERESNIHVVVGIRSWF